MYGPGSSIGTQRESSLHASLKEKYTGNSGLLEIEREGYVCDGITEEGVIIEVQTGSFGPLRIKAPTLASYSPVRIIFPVIHRRYIETYAEDGIRLRRRLSPRRGSPWDIFSSLVYAPLLPKTPNLSITLAILDALEERILDGKGSWRRKGARIRDKKLLCFHEELVLKELGDYIAFIPFSMDQEFTVRDLSEAIEELNVTLARKVIYVLYKLDLIERVCKRGNAWKYRRKP